MEGQPAAPGDECESLDRAEARAGPRTSLADAPCRDYAGTMSGLCRDYVGILSDRTSVLRRDYVGIASELCRGYVGSQGKPR